MGSASAHFSRLLEKRLCEPLAHVSFFVSHFFKKLIFKTTLNSFSWEAPKLAATHGASWGVGALRWIS
jgi:hypothetical protein